MSQQLRNNDGGVDNNAGNVEMVQQFNNNDIDHDVAEVEMLQHFNNTEGDIDANVRNADSLQQSDVGTADMLHDDDMYFDMAGFLEVQMEVDDTDDEDEEQEVIYTIVTIKYTVKNWTRWNVSLVKIYRI